MSCLEYLRKSFEDIYQQINIPIFYKPFTITIEEENELEHKIQEALE